MQLELTLFEIEYLHDTLTCNKDLYLIENNEDSINYNDSYKIIIDEIEDYLSDINGDYTLIELNYDDFKIITGLLKKHKENEVAISILNKLDNMLEDQFLISCATNNINKRIEENKRFYQVWVDFKNYTFNGRGEVVKGKDKKKLKQLMELYHEITKPTSIYNKVRKNLKNLDKNEFRYNLMMKDIF